MWKIEYHADFEKRLKKLQKKHRRETRNALSNADTFFRALCAGAQPQNIIRGFIHPEPHGVLAFDQSGEGKHLKATRLYTYPDEFTKTLHFITLGDKASQDGDIRLCSAFVEGLLDSPVGDPEDSGE